MGEISAAKSFHLIYSACEVAKMVFELLINKLPTTIHDELYKWLV